MKTSILLMIIVLSMVLIPVGSALEVPLTSYWGTATVDGSPIQGASITAYDATGNIVAEGTSLEHGLYTVKVQWDDLTTTDIDEGAVEGETITFKINGITATSSVIKAKGTNNPLDLAVTASTTSDSSKSSNGNEDKSTLVQTGTEISVNKSLDAQADEEYSGESATPVLISAETPEKNSTQVQTDTETPEKPSTTTPTSGKKTPGFGIITAIFALVCLSIRIK